jgi:hypothetical protein
MYLKILTATGFLAATVLVGCVSREAQVQADADDCLVMGHIKGTQSYDFCTKSLNKRRCEDRSSRDPSCQSAGEK